MSLRNSKTTADYLPWSEMVLLVQKLERDQKYMLALLIGIGSYTGLRISDMRTLRWRDLVGQVELSLIEQKTKKQRTIRLSGDLQELLVRLFRRLGRTKECLVLENPKTNRSFSVQYINRLLKQIKRNYKLQINHFSTHTMRKTFGRHIWELSNYSERSVMLLSEMFNHSSFKITRRYLGINNEEISGIYDLL